MIMKNKFLSDQWPFLKNLYGENVFEEYVFHVTNIYFQKWINPLRVEGYNINIQAKIEVPPVNTLKKWNDAKGASLTLSFVGDFGLGHFTFKNRRLFNLKNKYCRFKFKELDENYYEVTLHSETTDYCFIFRRLHIMFISKV